MQNNETENNFHAKSLYDFEDLQDFREYKYDNFQKIAATYTSALKKYADKFIFASVLEQVDAHPTELTNPYWQWLFSFGLSSDDIHRVTNTNFHYDTPPFWSAERNGQSRTTTPDGREIYIGGEYEDSYDPQFYIYNDVIVKHPNGEIQFFGYPREVFSPTDFHSATLIDKDIWIVGSIGYFQQRNFESTQIYKLNIESYQITKVETANSPGWISRHQAHFEKNKIVISGGQIDKHDDLPLTENIDTWSLDINTLEWKNLTNHQWQRFYVKKKDNSYLNLFTFSSLLFSLEHMPESYKKDIEQLKEDLRCEPDIESFKRLYIPPLDFTEDDGEYDFNTVAILIDGIKIRYVDNMKDIQVYVEGILPNEKLTILQNDLKDKLSRIENAECIICEVE